RESCGPSSVPCALASAAPQGGARSRVPSVARPLLPGLVRAGHTRGQEGFHLGPGAEAVRGTPATRAGDAQGPRRSRGVRLPEALRKVQPQGEVTPHGDQSNRSVRWSPRPAPHLSEKAACVRRYGLRTPDPKVGSPAPTGPPVA